MKTTWIVLAIALLCSVAAAGIYAYAYMHTEQSGLQIPLLSSSHTALPTPTIEDGTYTVQIHSILTNNQDSFITFTHVTYFEGKEASTSASHEVKCPTDRPIEACVPTLVKHYYVRPSGAPEFSAALTSASHLILRDSSKGTVAMLKHLNRQFDPVFDVAITNGVIDSLVEKSPL